MSIDIEQLKTDAAYWDDVAPEGAGYFMPESGLWYMNAGASEKWFVFCEKAGEWESSRSVGAGSSNHYDPLDFIKRPTFTATPELKKLTQAVFDGLPSEYRWAVTDGSKDGLAFAAVGKPRLQDDGRMMFWIKAEGDKNDFIDIGFGYDPTGWSNSLIERECAAKDCHDLKSANDFIERPTFTAEQPQHHDPVNSPSHYASGGIECIDAMQAMLSREEFIGYLRGNIFKYQWRYKLKNGVEDLEKAQWYANRLIKMERGE